MKKTEPAEILPPAPFDLDSPLLFRAYVGLPLARVSDLAVAAMPQEKRAAGSSAEQGRGADAGLRHVRRPPTSLSHFRLIAGRAAIACVPGSFQLDESVDPEMVKQRMLANA